MDKYEIDGCINLTDAQCDEFAYHNDELAIVCRNNALLESNDENEVYFGDNPDLFGLYIGKNHPLLQKILDTIYDEEEEIKNEIIIDNESHKYVEYDEDDVIEDAVW